MKKLFWVSLCLSLFVGCASIPVKEELVVEYYNLGNAYNDLGRYEEAADYYLRALDLNPELLQAGYNLARVLVLEEEYEESLDILYDLLVLDEENLMVHKTLGYALYHEGRMEDAKNEYLFVLERLVMDEETLYNLSIISANLEDWEGSITFLDQLASVRDLEKLEIKDKCHYLIQLERYQDCLDLILLQEGEDGISDVFDLYQAYAYQGLENYGEAVVYFKKALDSSDSALDKPELSWELAQIYLLRIEDIEIAKTQFKDAMDIGFDDEEQMLVLLEDLEEPLKGEILMIFSQAGFFVEDDEGDDETVEIDL